MTRRNVLLRDSFHAKGLDAVRHAHQQFDHLISLPPMARVQAAKNLPEVFLDAMVMDINGNHQMALDRLKSHFYVSEVISLNDLVTQARRRRFSYFIDRIRLFTARKPATINAAYKDISKPIEPRSLSVEMDLLFKTIRAAHAPTAAISAASSSI